MSWFIFDGVDIFSALTSIDRAGSLNNQIVHLQDNVNQAYLFKCMNASVRKEPGVILLSPRDKTRHLFFLALGLVSWFGVKIFENSPHKQGQNSKLTLISWSY